IFAVVPFVVAQSEKPFFQHFIGTVPKRKGEAKQLFVIAGTRNPILIPAVGAAHRIAVSGVTPGITVTAVVFAHRTPLSVTYVWPPFFPAVIGHSLLYCGHKIGRAHG